ncbi:MAG: GNAT family N-acetyltransferase [Gammaproteobacteria bacterium]|nr:GNAT family N-acetyltransferase [Gammaproteobacteria bacterium]
MGKVIMTHWLAPVPITSNHELSSFNSGEESLDEWLKKRALKNQTTGASRTFVLSDNLGKVAGYYCLSAGAIGHEIAPKKLRRNMPDLLPILLLGRLAIDKSYHNMGFGSALLRDALIRSTSVASNTGVFALLVHALSDQAKQFYLSRGFVESPLQPMTLIMTLETVRLILNEASN